MDCFDVKLIQVTAESYWNGGSHTEVDRALLNPVTGEITEWGPLDVEEYSENEFILDGHYIKLKSQSGPAELRLNTKADSVIPADRWRLAQFTSPEFFSFLDAETVADAIQIPLASWTGQCFAVASQMIKVYHLEGVAVFGMFVGKIAKKSHFSDRQHGFTQHGWIRMKSGALIDPTRWAFEAVTPYIFVTTEPEHPDYDEGANTVLELRQKFRQSSGLVQKGNDLAVHPALSTIVGKLLGDSPRTGISTSEVFAVANTPLNQLGPFAKEVYTWLVQSGYSAAIPIDNRNRVLHL